MSEIERVLTPGSAQAGEPAAPPAAPAGGLFDLAGTLERLGDDHELLKEVAAIYVASARGQVETIGAALGRGDLVETYREAHSLKGATATFEAPSVVAAVAEVEACGKRGDAAAANAAFAPMRELIGRLLAEIEPLAQGANVA